jgi:putative polyketide hydroxylase
MTRHDVLVVGAGPAGLTLAISLARHDLDVLVIEKHTGTSPFPKATGVSARTMELLRTWGLDEQVRAGAMAVLPALAVSHTLTGPVRALVATGYPTDAQALAAGPVAPCQCPQDHLEPVLLAHLRERGGRVRFGTELIGLHTDDTGVAATVRDRASGLRSAVRASWVVGADGPRSTVRSRLGIGIDDLGTIGDATAVTFRADLTRRLPRTPYALNAVEIPGAEGLFVPTGNDRWIYARTQDAHRAAAYWSPQRCTELLRAATGLPDLDADILSVQSFTMGGHVASEFRAGRAFLVGDAAHRTTPMGGIGMNTAIQGAHNLGWKLAWVLRGWAGEALLDSYEAERRPVGTENVLRSLSPQAVDGADGLAFDLGTTYDSAFVDPGAGGRTPHVRVRYQGSTVSTVDLFDGRLTVLTGRRGTRWRRPAADLAAGGLPIVALSIGRELDELRSSLADRLGIGDTGAALVRPDGHLAWRHPGPATEPAAALRAAVDRTLGWVPGQSMLAEAG